MRLGWLALAVSVAATPAGCGYPTFEFVLGAGGGSSTSGTGGGPPLTCAAVDDTTGCCDAKGVVHFCDQMGALNSTVCSQGNVCGWDFIKMYYDCVPPPSQPDPTHMFPLACK
jgi:hypothetical protein